jgi:hypothetical protein
LNDIWQLISTSRVKIFISEESTGEMVDMEFGDVGCVMMYSRQQLSAQHCFREISNVFAEVSLRFSAVLLVLEVDSSIDKACWMNIQFLLACVGAFNRAGPEEATLRVRFAPRSGINWFQALDSNNAPT